LWLRFWPKFLPLLPNPGWTRTFIVKIRTCVFQIRVNLNLLSSVFFIG
jgi:hypothetical protein